MFVEHAPSENSVPTRIYEVSHPSGITGSRGDPIVFDFRAYFRGPLPALPYGLRRERMQVRGAGQR